MSRIVIEPSAPGSFALAAFLADWPRLPHRRSWRGEAGGLARLVTARIQRTLDTPGTAAWSATRDGALAGFATLLPLAWDSDVLGFPAARVELYAAGEYAAARTAAASLLEAAREGARAAGLQHLSARVDAADDAAVHALESAGYLNVDALVTFSAAPAALPPRRALSGVEFRRASAADAAALGELAAGSFRDGRFHADPSIPPDRAREVYRRWAAACCDGSAADAVIAATIDGRAAGFVACRLTADPAVFLPGPAGTIPLIAVDRSARGRGVGAGLVAHAGAWFAGEGAAVVEVGTQVRNVAAARLYEGCGFRLGDSALSFRLMIDPD